MAKLSGYEANRLLKKESKRRKGVQPVLESGVDIKTVNSESLVGPGNIVVSGGGSTAAYISVTFDNGAEDVDVGAFCDVYVPYAFTISSVTLLANESGSIVVDVWKDTYGNYPPTVADKITASTPPTLSGTNKGQDSTLTGWNKTVAAGSTLRFNVNSCTGIKRCQILIEGVKA